MYFETGSDSEFSVNRYAMIIHEIIISLKKALKRVPDFGKKGYEKSQVLNNFRDQFFVFKHQISYFKVKYCSET